MIKADVAEHRRKPKKKNNNCIRTAHKASTIEVSPSDRFHMEIAFRMWTTIRSTKMVPTIGTISNAQPKSLA